MAEVRQCFGRGAHHFAHKCPFSLPETIGKQVKVVSRASTLPAVPLWDEALLYGRETPAEGGTVTRDGYTRLKAWTAAEVSAHKNLTEDCLLLSKTSRGSALPHCGSCGKVWRVFLSYAGGQLASVRAYSAARCEPLYRTKTGYYDILEVSTTATQAQIKTAYYKQSFVYHPDRNAGSDAATVRFSEISEAYTVLGNIMLRKKYDRGQLNLADLTATFSRPPGKDSSSGKQQSQRSVMRSGSLEGVFDFDSFFKSHYGQQLQKERDTKARRERLQRGKEKVTQEKVMDAFDGVTVCLVLIMTFGVILAIKNG